jgi:hypothetical protein
MLDIRDIYCYTIYTVPKHRQTNGGKRMVSIVIVLTLFPGSVVKDKPSLQLIAAIGQVESEDGGNTVGGKLSGHGYMQIRQICLDDVNSHEETRYKMRDMSDRNLSVFVFQCYMKMYANKKRLGRKPTDRDRARIWNGGPNGWKERKTLAYWARVKRHMSPA